MKENDGKLDASEAIPNGWLFRVDGCSEWMAVQIGNRTKVGSLPQKVSRRKHRLSGRPDCAQIDFQGVGVENPSFGYTLATNPNLCCLGEVWAPTEVPRGASKLGGRPNLAPKTLHFRCLPNFAQKVSNFGPRPKCAQKVAAESWL